MTLRQKSSLSGLLLATALLAVLVGGCGEQPANTATTAKNQEGINKEAQERAAAMQKQAMQKMQQQGGPR